MKMSAIKFNDVEKLCKVLLRLKALVVRNFVKIRTTLCRLLRRFEQTLHFQPEFLDLRPWLLICLLSGLTIDTYSLPKY